MFSILYLFNNPIFIEFLCIIWLCLDNLFYYCCLFKQLWYFLWVCVIGFDENANQFVLYFNLKVIFPKWISYLWKWFNVALLKLLFKLFMIIFNRLYNFCKMSSLRTKSVFILVNMLTNTKNLIFITIFTLYIFTKLLKLFSSPLK